MTTDSSPSQTDAREWRRMCAWGFDQQGWARRAITVLGITRGAFSQ